MSRMVDEKWFSRVVDARRLLDGYANETPVITSRTLDSRVGASLFLKCENFQRAGSFKFRGAFNAISRLTDEERASGVVTHSSGNHAQAVALVGNLLDVQTTIVMPNDAPPMKRAATEEYGAKVVDYDPVKVTREAISADLVREHGYTLVPPYDHRHIVSGQGTATLELIDEIDDLDVILAPCGGGGLLSGTGVAARGANRNCRVIGVEPEVADDATRSFYTGKLHTVRNPPTIADGTRTPSLGEITFPLVQEYVQDMVTVSEDSIVESVRFLFERMKLVVEPSGALGIAALLSGRAPAAGRIGVIISGGNIDGRTMASILFRDMKPQ